MKWICGRFLGSIASVYLFVLLLPVAAQADPGNQYCITPPFITAGLKPNLLLMIDNSASMYDLQYQDTTNMYCANAPTTACTTDSTCSAAGMPTGYCIASSTTTTTTTAAACTKDTDCQPPNPGGVVGDTCFLSGIKKNTCKTAVVTTATVTPIACTADTTCSAITAGDTCNNKCNSTRQCYDTSYSGTTTYYGYFDATATYSYDFTTNKFTSGAAMPGTCTYSAGTPGYFCVNTAGTPEAVVTTGSTGFVASGNFLNWLTASKFDIEKKILTGGKFDTVNNVLVAESRGCSGRDFLKSVSGVNLTFAIRGGTPGGISSTQSLATEYGQTYIEIYAGVYNAAACLSAMNDWIGVVSGTPPNLGSFQNDSKSCVGAGSGALNPTNMWNHVLHNCYWGILNIAGGYSGNLSPLEGECQSVYATVLPSAITDPNSGISICSSALTYTINGITSTGYLGACYNTVTKTFSSPCDVTQIQNYCNANVTTNPVVDPSSTSTTTASATIPGFVMQQGLTNLTQVGVLTVKVGLATPPTGLIDKYSDRIRFGAMTFQNNGSGSECGGTSSIPCAKVCSVSTTRMCYLNTDCPSGETCGALSLTDGGKIISYVGAGSCSATTTTACNVDSDCSGLTPSGQYCVPSKGSHSSGLIKSIDDIPATSWTPFAEVFYSAMGYFARTNDYTASPPTSRSDANFNSLPAPNTAASYDTSKNPSQYRCQSNNVLLVTDGMSTADQNTASEALATLYASQVPYITKAGTTYNPGSTGYDPAKNHGYDSTGKCPTYSGSRSIANLAWVAKNRNIKSASLATTAITTTPQAASESISTYVVYSGPQTSSQPDLCDPKTLMTNTATNGGTTLFAAADPTTLYTQLDSAFSTVAAKAASGTAASILSNSEGSGANILQAVFYPKKNFENSTSAYWIGEMQNLWYYVDPYINNSTIREDTDGDLKLNLINDYVARFAFDSSSNKTMVQLYKDTNGDGTNYTAIGGLIDPDYVKSIWRAGKLLWARNISTSPRTIKTSINGSTLIDFSSATFPGGLVASNAATLAPYLNVTATNAPTLINWVHGQDQTGYRSRSVDIKDPVTNSISSGVWRLGDIISSTPRVQSTVRLNTYNLPPPGGYNDNSYLSYINSNQYKGRGMVYVGGNDGMFHAFNLGLLSVQTSGFQKATLSGSNLGNEQWAYIPKNVLPYLQYMADPAYGHLYYLDGRTSIFDASIGYTGVGTCVRGTYDTCDKSTLGSVVDSNNNLDATRNTWRTVVIGGMGLGGASQKTCAVGANCVQTPLTDPSDTINNPGLGYSSYFAFDVTDPNSPSLLWEFSNPALGYATGGPAIVRVGNSQKNGKWFAVFGSGPTGPIDTSSHQFLGTSNQNLKFFVVDLQNGTLVKTIDTTIPNAFVGSMIGGAIDVDRANPTVVGNYQDDAIYVGYVKQAVDGTWTKGGVGRIMTMESTDPNDVVNPWRWNVIIDDIGPVTTAISRLQDKKNRNLWLYFGTGRYFFRNSSALDDNSGSRSLYGIKDPCYNTITLPGNLLDKTCTAAITGSPVNQTNIVTALAAGAPGWQIDLDAATTSEGAERVVTDTVALPNGTVFFTSFKPTMDICGFGGNSFLWGVKFDTGGQASAGALQGKALIQLSTGEFKEVDLSTAFTDKGNRRIQTPMTGKPPSDAPPIISNSQNKPVKKILHIQEH